MTAVDTTTPNAAGVVAKKPADACFTKSDPEYGKADAAETARRWGRAEAFGCPSTSKNAADRWAVLEALQGGRKGVPQLALASMYLNELGEAGEEMTADKIDDRLLHHHPEYAGKIGKLLDDSVVDEQLKGHDPSEIAYVHQIVQKARGKYKILNAKAPVTDNDEIAAWFDAWEKDPEIFKLGFEVRTQLASATWQTWKFDKIPACKRVREKIFELAPVDQPTNSNDLAKKFNTMSGLGLLELATTCGYMQGDPGEGDAWKAVTEEVRTTARYGSKSDFPKGDVSTEKFLAPFFHGALPSLPNYADMDESQCWGHGYGLRGSMLLEEDLGVGWGEVAARKDTPDGVLVTFKKAVWMQNKIECTADGSGYQWNGVAWEANRSCNVVGQEQAEHQEPPTLVPSDAAKEIKPGRMVSILNTSSNMQGKFCPVAPATTQRRGIPLFVHKNGGNTFKKDDQVQIFFWSVKREAAPKP